jgi:hypothetical protein
MVSAQRKYRWREMEPEALDARRSQRGLPGAADGVPLARPEHVPLGTVRPPTGSNGVCVQAERHLAAPTALRTLQSDYAARAVNAVPCQPERFTLPQDTRAIQHYLGHRNIQHTVRYTQMAPDRRESARRTP